MKRILIVTQYIYPENFKSSDLAFELARRGYRVDVLTGIPNYPEGVYFKGYGLFKKRVETVDGVHFYRCFQTPRGRKGGSIGLSINYLSFMFVATLWCLFYFAWKKKYDAIIAHEPSPITQIVPAIILGRIRKTPVYSWIMDIWPDSVVSTIGEDKAKGVKQVLNCITNWVYRHSTKILITSTGMKALINRDADYSEKIVYFPNWCDDIMNMPKKEISKLPDGFKIMMAGNIADGLGVESIVELVEKSAPMKDVKYVFLGGGSKVDYFREEFAKRGLANAVMLGRKPFDEMSAYYAEADAMLLTLKPTNLPHLSATVPARLQSYMAAGKPVLAMIDGCAADMINDNDCGYAVPAGAVDKLIEKIEIVLADRDAFAQKGRNARALYESEFTKSKCIDNLERIISVE